MISVIIPIYNVSQYLSQCVDSVLTQSYRDLEIILVDDGSTDDCPRMCDAYQEKDSRVWVIHKKNGGLSDARNAGMKIAIGEWTLFVDSDDWLEKDTIMKLYQFAVDNCCDVVQTNMYYAYDDYLLYRKTCRKEQKKNVLSRQEAMRELIINDRVKNFAWGKLYKTNILRDLNFPIGKYFEDSFWQHLVFDRVERYGIIDEPFWYYRQRRDSISATPSNKLNDLLEGNWERMGFIRERYPELFPLMENKYKELYNQINPPKEFLYKQKDLIYRILARLRTSKFLKIKCAAKE